MLPVAILCGGLGTRMRPHTLHIPKPMIEVNGEPFLAHLLRSLAAGGVEHVVLLIGYLGNRIVDFVAAGDAFGLRVEYVWDGDAPLGTAGAVRRALPLLGERFFVTYGDAYLRVNYREVGAAFERAGRGGLMTVYRYRSEGTTPPNTAVAGGRVTRYDKESNAPSIQYVDYGLSAFASRAFDGVADGESADLAAINRRLIAASDLAALIIDDLPFEIGSPEGLAATQRYLRRPV